MKARAGQIDGVGGAGIVAGTRTLDGNMAGIFWFRNPGQEALGELPAMAV